MDTFLASLIIFGIVLLMLGVGVMFGRDPLRGSCGGVNGGQCSCGATREEDCRLKGAK